MTVASKRRSFSIDAFPGGITVRKQPSASFRQVRQPQFCMVVDPSEVTQSAEALATRIKASIYRAGCPVFLYIDDDMRAYIIPEDKPMAQQWITEHFGWLVAVYAFIHRTNAPMLRPTLAGIHEDLRAHLADLGWAP